MELLNTLECDQDARSARRDRFLEDGADVEAGDQETHAGFGVGGKVIQFVGQGVFQQVGPGGLQLCFGQANRRCRMSVGSGD